MALDPQNAYFTFPLLPVFPSFFLIDSDECYLIFINPFLKKRISVIIFSMETTRPDNPNEDTETPEARSMRLKKGDLGAYLTSYPFDGLEAVDESDIIAKDDIAELGKYAEELLEKLKDDIHEGKIGLIIGDDISGRLLTLIMRGVINQRYQANGQDKVPTFFLTGDMRLSEPEAEMKSLKIKEWLVTKDLDQEKKVLIVTDSIAGGHTLLPLVKALNQLNLQHITATTGLVSPGMERVDLGEIVHLNNLTPRIYDNEEKRGLAGVDKTFGSGQIFSDARREPELTKLARHLVNEEIDRIVAKEVKE